MKNLAHFRKLEPQPRLTVVGAGPGDPELITLKAIKAIASAQAVLYDALVDKSLLEHCSPTCEQIYVGKKPGESHSQAAINELIVEKAYALGHVVRLKGGDPFVFGRGQEEIEFAKSYGLITGYIPGISSSYAAAGAADIPLTVRGVNESFWVMTGTKSDGSLSEDLKLGLQSTATLVILMGMSQLAEIASLCQQYGKGEISTAIIQNGTMANQRIGISTAAELENLAKKEDLRNPAIIVIGEVVRHAKPEMWEKILNMK
ncbi:MAG: uroporphyrinogen-III C-methyltransferase [Cytophagaceae bacterium]|nr:uroporphyrinogen-III C-methyltransferase [Cytophagaceae bacterium]MBP6093159.1 uroporphyrinogen-III C-methyltransferase [Cytophagaceae bacterium]